MPSCYTLEAAHKQKNTWEIEKLAALQGRHIKIFWQSCARMRFKPLKLLLLAQSRGMMGKYLLESSLAHLLPRDEKPGSLREITVRRKRQRQSSISYDMESLQIKLDIITSITCGANKITFYCVLNLQHHNDITND